MDRETFETTIQTFKHRKPWRPFTIALVNGDRLEVDHPEAVVIRAGAGAFLGPAGVLAVFDYEGVNQIIGDLAGTATE